MTLSVTVLGGAAAWPNPGQGCSSYLVADGSTTLLLDCGPNTLLKLRRHVDFRNVDAVVISHCHADHILDLVPYRYGLKYGFDRPGKRVPLWLPPRGIERLEMLADALAYGSEGSAGFWTDVFDLSEYDPSRPLVVGTLSATFAPTQHFVPCFATRIDAADGSSVGYTADTGAIDSLVTLMSSASLLIAEATERDHGDRPVEQRGHLTPRDAGELAEQAGAGRLLLTHLWSERPADEVIRDAATAYRGDIVVAGAGMRIDV